MAINRTRQRKILEAAALAGELDQLYWYPVATNQRGEPPVAVGAVPSIPAVPVGDDPETSRHWAHLLIELMVCPGVTFGLELSTAALLDGCGTAWFVWGAHDHVCPGCGAIGNDCICPAIHVIEEVA